MSIDVCSATVDQGSIVYDQPVIPFETGIIQEGCIYPALATATVQSRRPYEIFSSMLPSDLSGVRAEREKILAGIYVSSVLETVITGSIAWMLQTGASLEEVTKLAKDVDCVAPPDIKSSITLYSYGVDEVDVISPGWRERVVRRKVDIEGEELDISLVHYHDVALTVCRHVERRSGDVFSNGNMSRVSIIDLLRKARALVYLYNYSQREEGISGEFFRQEIINGLGNIKTILLSNKHIASRVQDGSKDNFLPLSIYNSLIAFLEHDGRSFSFLYTAIGLPR